MYKTRLIRAGRQIFENHGTPIPLSHIPVSCSQSLKHAKSLLSGIFTYAKNLGVLDGVNPVEGTIIPRKAAAPAETHASSADEVVAMLDVLKRAKNLEERQKLQAQTAIALISSLGCGPVKHAGHVGKIMTAKPSA